MQRLPGATFTQDNARPHTARVSQDCLRTVTTLPWATRSPDLPKKEHIWVHLGRQVGRPTSLNELVVRLQQIWIEMSQNIIQNLYFSMPERIASCICAGGGSTRSSNDYSPVHVHLMPVAEIKCKDGTTAAADDSGAKVAVRIIFRC
ncbi:transposable element Tcb1 transposase [Trichonephila clavipes]|nr:transposable element Tcb1 transposase [Trichonephila clavipes]